MSSKPVIGTFAKVALAVSFVAALAACNEKPLGYYGTGFESRDMPGTPRTHVQIYRRLLEDGYELRGDVKQAGAVYFADVTTVKGNKPKCLILHAFSGTILQSFAVTPKGFAAEIKDAPGPGFPGYPPVPDGRYALLCEAIMPAVTKGDLVIPGIGPETLRMRF